MSRTQYFCAASLDGFIAESDDTLEWLTKYQGSFEGPTAEPMKGTYQRFYDGVGALVMGSATYEFVLVELSEWPYQGKPTWILSSRELPEPGGEDVDVQFGKGSIRELVADMLAAGERNLWVVGGGNVASQFADAGLLDEVIVTIVPVVLGGGKPLFDRRVSPAPLQLTGTRTFDSGMVELHYQVPH